MDFEPITTQEDLDRVVAAAVEKQHGAITAENARLKAGALKARVAHEMGLPYEMASRLQGENEDDIRKDAQALKGIFKGQQKKAPGVSYEPGKGGGDAEKKAALRNLARSLTGEN